MSELQATAMSAELKVLTGLSDQEVRERMARGDVNRVVMRSSRTYTAILRENVFTLFHVSFGIVLLIMAALGQITDALFSGFAVFTNIIVGVIQEIQAKWTLDRLALLSVQEITVIRNGVSLIVPVAEVVRDDLVELKPGDRAPVDGAVVQSNAVEMDESLLTGESDPVPKQVGDVVLSGRSVNLYIMDDWRARPNLTLNLGVRYENQTFTDDDNNVAPRIGFAYNVAGDSRTVSARRAIDAPRLASTRRWRSRFVRRGPTRLRSRVSRARPTASLRSRPWKTSFATPYGLPTRRPLSSAGARHETADGCCGAASRSPCAQSAR